MTSCPGSGTLFRFSNTVLQGISQPWLESQGYSGAFTCLFLELNIKHAFH